VKALAFFPNGVQPSCQGTADLSRAVDFQYGRGDASADRTPSPLAWRTLLLTMDSAVCRFFKSRGHDWLLIRMASQGRPSGSI